MQQESANSQMCPRHGTYISLDSYHIRNTVKVSLIFNDIELKIKYRVQEYDAISNSGCLHNMFIGLLIHRMFYSIEDSKQKHGNQGKKKRKKKTLFRPL